MGNSCYNVIYIWSDKKKMYDKSHEVLSLIDPSSMHSYTDDERRDSFLEVDLPKIFSNKIDLGTPFLNQAMDNALVSMSEDLISFSRKDSRSSIKTASEKSWTSDGEGGRIHKYKFFVDNNTESAVWCVVHNVDVFYEEVHGEVAAGASNVSAKGGARRVQTLKNQLKCVPGGEMCTVHMAKPNKAVQAINRVSNQRQHALISFIWQSKSTWYFIEQNTPVQGNDLISVKPTQLIEQAVVTREWLESNNIRFPSSKDKLC